MTVGTRLRRHDCTCLPGVADAREKRPWWRMHSEVSRDDVADLVAGDGPDLDLDEDDLRDLVAEHDTVLVCNVCGEVKTPEGS